MGKQTLQHFELHVLLAMLRERGETYSVPLVLALEQRMERPVSQAAVFIALSRLEKKGLVASRLDERDGGARAALLQDHADRASPRARDRHRTRAALARPGTARSAPQGLTCAGSCALLVDEADRQAIESDLAELYEFRKPRRRRTRGGALAAPSTAALPRPSCSSTAPARDRPIAGWDHDAASLARRRLQRYAASRARPR